MASLEKSDFLSRSCAAGLESTTALATPIDTGRIAAVAAQCLEQLVTIAPNRQDWFTRLIKEETSCLLGANAVARAEDGDLAFGLSYRGQVVRLGLDDVATRDDEETCPTCGRPPRPEASQSPAWEPTSLVDDALCEIPGTKGGQGAE